METWSKAIEARKDNIDLLAVAVGEGADKDELRGVVSDPVDSNIFMVDRFDDLASVKSRVRDAICQGGRAALDTDARYRRASLLGGRYQLRYEVVSFSKCCIMTWIDPF